MSLRPLLRGYGPLMLSARGQRAAYRPAGEDQPAPIEEGDLLDDLLRLGGQRPTLNFNHQDTEGLLVQTKQPQKGAMVPVALSIDLTRC